MKRIIKIGRLYPVSSPPVDNAFVLTENGKIVSVTAGNDADAFSDAERLDMSDYAATPGLIDAHTFIALSFEPRGMREQSDSDECSDPLMPQLHVADGFYPHDFAIGTARRAGFTTCYVSQGFLNVAGGIGAAFKMSVCNNAVQMMLPHSEHLNVSMGDIPINFYKRKKKAPMTRMALAAMLRDLFRRAKIYAEEKSPVYDEKLESLKPLMRGEMTAFIHACRNDDMLTAIRICEEFGIRFAFVNASEAAELADVLSEKQIPCIWGPIFAQPFQSDNKRIRFDTPVILDRMNLKDICFTCNETDEIEFLRAYAGRFRIFGMSSDRILECLTIVPARILGVSDRVGSIEAGKDADLAFFNGDPLSNLTLCVGTMIDGKFYDWRPGQ